MLKPALLAISAAASALLFPALPALAEQHHAKLETAFKQADKDGDGTLDKDEAKAMPRVSKNFDAIDTDKDGTVDLDEVRTSMQKASRDMRRKGMSAFEKADKDNDGTLDREEAKAMPRVAENFDAIDTDKSGTVDRNEIKASMQKAGKDMHRKGESAFKQADKDNDGTLDKDEAKAMPRVAENFDAIDADKDGTVSREEIHNYMSSTKKK